MSVKDLRCIHRHTFEEHPSCFYNGKVKLPKGVKKVYVDKNGELKVVPWWAHPDIRVGYLDIEVTNLKANIGFMLTWAIKERSGITYYDIIRKEEALSLEEDKRIVESLLNKMSDYDIIVTYYGKRFDVPFIRTRALYHNLDTTPLEYRETFHWDLYDTVKRKLKLHRNSLEVVTKFLGIEGDHGGKNHVDMPTWKMAAKGDSESLMYVLNHNIRDVEILEILHDKLWFFSSNPRTSI